MPQVRAPFFGANLGSLHPEPPIFQRLGRAIRKPSVSTLGKRERIPESPRGRHNRSPAVIAAKAAVNGTNA